MGSDTAIPNETPTLTFEEFWDWVTRHPNCILRAGTQDTVIYDDEDYHWHFAVEGADTPIAQVIRGKRMVAEILIARERIAYVQGVPGDVEGEHLFDLVEESESERITAYFFVVSHPYETQDSAPTGPHSVH